MAKFAAFDVERRRAKFTRLGRHLFRRHEDEFGLRINELLDEPGARHPVHLHFLARNPFHHCREYVAGFGRSPLNICSELASRPARLKQR